MLILQIGWRKRTEPGPYRGLRTATVTAHNNLARLGAIQGEAMDRKTAVAKIRKCLNLAGSAEPHEAAAALRQAQKLVAEFGVGDFELAGVCIDEAWVKSSASARPPRFEVQLASVVAGAFGCEIVFTRRLNATRTRIIGGYAFIGVAPAEQIASYAFTVLARQLRAARARYVAETLRRCQPRNRTARADQFCEGWVTAARRLVQASNVSEPDALRLEGYLRAHYADTRRVALRSRAVARHVDPLVDKVRGFANGAKARLHGGLPSAQEQLTLGCSES